MAMFMKLGPVQAGDIDSEAATDGQVLTADGAGAAAWEDAGGGSVAFDGAAFALAEWSDYENVDFTITPTLNGIPITSRVYIHVFVWNVGSHCPASVTLSVDGDEFRNGSGNPLYAYVNYASPPTFHLKVESALAAFEFVVTLPDSSYIVSDTQYVPGG